MKDVSKDEERDPQKPDPNMEEKRVIGLEEAGDNFGVEDTPYNAPEEVEAQKRLRERPE
jgi:hypothetical protein